MLIKSVSTKPQLSVLTQHWKNCYGTLHFISCSTASVSLVWSKTGTLQAHWSTYWQTVFEPADHSVNVITDAATADKLRLKPGIRLCEYPLSSHLRIISKPVTVERPGYLRRTSKQVALSLISILRLGYVYFNSSISQTSSLDTCSGEVKTSEVIYDAWNINVRIFRDGLKSCQVLKCDDCARVDIVCSCRRSVQRFHIGYTAGICTHRLALRVTGCRSGYSAGLTSYNCALNVWSCRIWHTRWSDASAEQRRVDSGWLKYS